MAPSLAPAGTCYAASRACGLAVPLRASRGRCRTVAPRAAAAAGRPEPGHVTRRVFFGIGVTLGGGLLASRAHAAPPAPAPADAPAFKTFLGYNVQPDLYLGQGYKLAVNYEGAPAYSFEYPGAFEAVPVSKTDKSTMGMDGMVADPKSPRTHAFVIALGGKDYAGARLTDTTSTLRAMAGSDPDLREAVSNASAVKATQAKINGVDTYCYEIEGDKAHYLAKVAIKDGTVFGLFASAPLAKWGQAEAGMRRIYDSFTLL